MANVGDSDWPDGGFVIRGINSEGLTPGGAPLAGFYIDGYSRQQTALVEELAGCGMWAVGCGMSKCTEDRNPH